MCGVAATFAYGSTGLIDVDALIRTRDHMAPRGPDCVGLWLRPDGRAGLAHRRLAVIDLSDSGAQPMTDDARVVSFNGEIYNHRVLHVTLEKKGYRFRSQSDTEVCSTSTLRRARRWSMTCAGCMPSPSGTTGIGGSSAVSSRYYYSDDGNTFRAAS